MKKSGLRIILLLFMALLLGLIFNQLHPQGIQLKLLVNPSLLFQSKISGDFHILSADSAFIFSQQSKVVFLDIRTPDDYELDHIPGAHLLPFQQIMSRGGNEIRISSELEVVLYDQEGDIPQLTLAANLLREGGYKNLYLLFGGYLYWLQEGYPVESGEAGND